MPFNGYDLGGLGTLFNADNSGQPVFRYPDPTDVISLGTWTYNNAYAAPNGWNWTGDLHSAAQMTYQFSYWTYPGTRGWWPPNNIGFNTFYGKAPSNEWNCNCQCDCACGGY